MKRETTGGVSIEVSPDARVVFEMRYVGADWNAIAADRKRREALIAHAVAKLRVVMTAELRGLAANSQTRTATISHER